MALSREGLKIDVNEVKKLYGALSELVYKDMDTQYREKKINGATYADTWAKLMDAVVGGAMNTVAQLQMKETPADICVKEEQCTSSQATTVRNDELADSNIEETNKKSLREECLSTAECALKDEQTKKVTAEELLVDAQTEEVPLKSAREECLATAECTLKDTQTTKVNYEISNVLPAQVAFTNRQTEGFDDNKNQKLLEIQMNAWAMMYSSGLMTDMTNGGVPRIINDDEVSDLYDLMSPV